MASVFGIVGSGTDVLNLNVNGMEIEYALLFLDFRDVATREEVSRKIDDLAERLQCVHCRVLRLLRADEILHLGRKKHVESNQTLQVLSQQTLCDFDCRRISNNHILPVSVSRQNRIRSILP